MRSSRCAATAELADMLKAKKPVLQHHADHARELQKSATDAQASATGTPTTTPATASPGTTTQGQARRPNQ